jgi:predicted transcriptional regulator
MPSILTTVRKRLNASKGKWRQVSIASGVPYDTLTKVAYGINKDPRISTVQKLVNYFDGQHQ